MHDFAETFNEAFTKSLFRNSNVLVLNAFLYICPDYVICFLSLCVSFFVKIIREWNDLPANVVEVENLRRFKIALKSYMCIS